MTKYIKGQPIEITLIGKVVQDLDTDERDNYVLIVDAGDMPVYVGRTILEAADSIELGDVPITLPTESGIYVHEPRDGSLPYHRTDDGKWFIVPMTGGAARRTFATDRAMIEAIRDMGPLVKVA